MKAHSDDELGISLEERRDFDKTEDPDHKLVLHIPYDAHTAAPL